MVCLFIGNLYGQNQHKLLWQASAFDKISLNLPFANTIVISTTLDDSIAVDYQTEGEYKNHLVLQSYHQGKSLQLSEQKGPSFQAFHDKLSAHKIWASTLTLYLPAFFQLDLKAQNARIDIRGNYAFISLELNEGEISLRGKAISGQIQTHKADVNLWKGEYKAFASSKHGIITGPFSPLDKSLLKINSVAGNISLISQRK